MTSGDQTTATDTQQPIAGGFVRLLSASGPILTFLLTVISIYFGFIKSLWQATGIVLAMVFLAILVAAFRWNTHRPRKYALMAIASIALAASCVLAAWPYLHPPPATRASLVGEKLMFDASRETGGSIPLSPGGSMRQQFDSSAGRITSFTIWTGLRDEFKARQHPLTLVVDMGEGRQPYRLKVNNMTNNGPTRFSMPEFARVENGTPIIFTVYNSSGDEIGVFVTPRSEVDIANGVVEPLRISGDPNVSYAYERPELMRATVGALF